MLEQRHPFPEPFSFEDPTYHKSTSEANLWKYICIPLILGIWYSAICCCSVAKSCLTLQPHGLQHVRLLCPSLSPRVCSNSCPLSWRCYLTISSSVSPFSSFPASGSFPMNWLFASGGQSTRASASATVLPMKIQDWFPLRLTCLISLQSKVLSRVSSPTPQFKSISSWTLSLLYGPVLTSAHDYWKNHSFDYVDFCQQSDVSAF